MDNRAESAFAAPTRWFRDSTSLNRTGQQRPFSKPPTWAVLIASAFFTSSFSQASIVTTTITGTVVSGYDVSGIFGFPPGTELTGQSYTLVYVFDDTKGTQSTQDSNGAACGTSITNTANSNPGTATLQIGSVVWAFSSASDTSESSAASRAVGACGSQVVYYVDDTIDSTDHGDVLAQVPLTPSITDDNWEDAFSIDQVPASVSPGRFNINLNATNQNAYGGLSYSSITVSGPSSGPSPAAGLQFIPLTPCRIADTRKAAGPFGGPELPGGTSREFDIPQSACSIPSTAVAYSLNVTVVPNAALGYLTVWPSGQNQPRVSTLNSDGRVKANAAIVPAGAHGGVSVFVTDPTHVILDINGYFVPAGSSSALAFYPVTPCRLVDTRTASGPLGGPSLEAGSSRNFPLQSGQCGLPSDAAAYSLNVTAVPSGILNYLSMWPAGQSQPTVSTLNAPTGAVTANAAIVPAGSNGEISIYVTNASDVVLDVNGYFATPSANGLSLYTTTPCRVLDTRNGSGAFHATLGVNVEGSSCAPSSAAQAYVLNATVVPSVPLGYLTLWPAGETQPVVSTLNAEDKAITSNMAIVPTTDGSINAFSSNQTELILDISSYFAP